MKKLNLDIGKFNSSDINDIAFASVKTGINSLDKALSGGFRPGLTVLGALPGTGKSTLAFQIARNVSSRGTPVIIYSLEMTRNQILSKMISRQTFISSPENAVSATDMLNSNRNRDISPLQWENIREARQIVEKETDNIYITESDDCGISASFIDNEVSEFIAKNPGASPFVIVDYLQFLAPNSNKTLSDKQAVDDNIRTLNALASEYKICVLLISSLNRNSYNGKITMLSFKESGSIEYSADTLISMEKATSGTEGENQSFRTVCLSFLKQRYGQTGISIKLRYDPRFDCFSDTGEPAAALETTECPQENCDVPEDNGKADPEPPEAADHSDTSGSRISDKKKLFLSLSED